MVTGATGLVGAEVARQIAATGANLVCTKRPTSILPAILEPYKKQITWLDADILDVFALDDAMQGVTQVYHCAAWVSFNAADKKRIIKTNVEGTANIANLCVEHGARLVHVSSIVAIGEAKPGMLITENNHLEETPHEDGYAISKYESEMEVFRAIAEGLDAVVVNPSLIIGKNAGNIFNMKITNRTPEFFDIMVDVEVRDLKQGYDAIEDVKAMVDNIARERTGDQADLERMALQGPKQVAKQMTDPSDGGKDA